MVFFRVVVFWVSENFEFCIMICFFNFLIVGSLRGLVVFLEFIFFFIGFVLGLLRWVVLMLLYLNGFISNLYVYKDFRVLCF